MTQQGNTGNKKGIITDTPPYPVDFLYTIVDSIADPLFVKDEQHRWVILNKAMLDWMGRPLDELIGKTDHDLFPKSEADVFWEQDNKVFASDQPIENEEVLTDKDGVHRVVSTKKVAKQLPDGRKLIVGTIRDITDQKKSGETIAKRANQLQVAFEVSQATTSLIDPEQLMQHVVDLINSRFNLYYVGLFLVDSSKRLDNVFGEERAVLQAGTGEAGHEMVVKRHKLPVNGKSMIGQCISSGEAKIASNVDNEAARYDNPLLPETRSELALPLINQGKTIGALTIQSSREDAFSVEDISTFRTLASLLANSIENARLFQQTQKALKENEEIQAQYTRALFGFGKNKR